MAGVPRALLRHKVVVSPYAGTDGFGQPKYAPEFVLRCFMDPKESSVTLPSGKTVYSTGTVYAALASADSVPVGSRVSIPRAGVSDRFAVVVAVVARDGGGLPTPDHVELVLS